MMPEDLTQEMANYLLNLDKEFVDESKIVLLDHFKIDKEIRSTDNKEFFHLSLYQGKIDLHKVSYNERYSSGIPLVRLDLTSGQHTNPDGERIIGPHIHIYQEGYGDTWATPLPGPDFPFTDLDNNIQCLNEFLDYCKIRRVRIIRAPSLNTIGE